MKRSDLKTKHLLFICVALTTVGVVLSSFFSFDLTDEGYILILSRLNQPNGWAVQVYPKFIGALNRIVEVGPFELRYLRLVMHLSCTLIFTGGFMRVLRQSGRGVSPWMFPFVFLFGFSSYLVFPNTLSYNAIAFNLAQLAAGIVFYDYSARQYRPIPATLRAIILGLVPIIMIYVKITSALLIAGILFFALAFNAAIHSARLFRFLTPGIYGILISALIGVLQLNETIPTPLSIVEKASLVSSLEHSHDPIKLVVAFLRFLGYTTFSVITGVFFSRYGKTKKASFAVMGSVGVILLIWVTTSDLLSHTLAMYFQAVAFIFLGSLFDRAKHGEWKVAVYWFVVSGFLFMMTIAVFAGTNNSNFLAFAPNSGLFFPTYLFLIGGNRLSNRFKKFFPVAFLLFVLVNLFVIPYRQPPLWTMNEKLETPHGRDIWVNSDLKNDVEVAEKGLVSLGYKKGDPIFAIYRMPGLVYLLEGYAPGGILWKAEQNEAFFHFLQKDSLKVCSPCYLVFRSREDAIRFSQQTSLEIIKEKKGRDMGYMKLSGAIHPITDY